MINLPGNKSKASSGYDPVVKVDKAISAEVVKGLNIRNYTPHVFGHEMAWNVSVELPEGIYKKWIPILANNFDFRNGVEQGIAVLFEGTLRYPSCITIAWGKTGAEFRLNRDCSTFISGDDKELTNYISNNVETTQQALVLQTCLTVYMHKVLSYLEIYEQNPEVYSRYADIETTYGSQITAISFNRRGLPKLMRAAGV